MGESQENRRIGGEAAEQAARLVDLVEAVASELHPGRRIAGRVSLDSSLDKDLGLDSLARVELFARIERELGTALSEHLLTSAETPRDLLRAMLVAGAPKAVFAAPATSGLELGEAKAAPSEAENLVDVLEWHVAAHPDRPHIQFYSDEGEGPVLTYLALKQGAERVAAGLQGLGLEAGEAVAIMLPTGAEYFFTFFGILKAGGIPVPMYPPARLTQIEEHLRRHAGIIANALARILVTVPEAIRLAQLLKSQVETLGHVVTVEELSRAPGAFAPPAIGGQDIAFLQYTSGSTGNPKGVMLTHANLLADIHIMGQLLEATPEDVFVSWLPLYHDMGLIGAWLGTMYYAAPLVLMSPLAFLAKPQRWLWAIHRYHGTLSAAPNFAYELCLNRISDADIEGLDLGSWRVACNGAEPVSPDTAQRFIERFGRYGFDPKAMMPVYGLAECAVGLTFPPSRRGLVIDRIDRDTFMQTGLARPAPEGDARALKFVNCGEPLPGHEIRIVDEMDRELPERHEGRLQFRGPSATSGYFRNPEKTRELFHGDWLDSGDLAYMAEGSVYITGRTKDMIIRAGRNIYPAELEDAVGNIPGIRKGGVAAFGSTDRKTGTERLIVLAESRKRDAEAREKLRQEVNAVALDLIGTPPDDVVIALPNTVPKTSSGKIRRAACRELYEKGLIDKPRRAVWLQVARLALAGLLPQMRRTARAVGAGLYGIYALAVLVIVATLVWILVAVLPVAGWRWRVMRAALGLLSAITATRVSVQGLENLPPPGSPCVFVSNHASYLDGPVLIRALPRRFAFVAKAELNAGFVSGVFLRRIGAEFVERFEKLKGVADAERIVGVARSGRSPLFFAEGTFTRTPGLLPFYMGAFLTAVEAGVPVVPVAIRGTRSKLRSETLLPRPGGITVIIGTPIEPEPAGAEGDVWARAVRLRDRVRKEILYHTGEPDLGAGPSPVSAMRPRPD